MRSQKLVARLLTTVLLVFVVPFTGIAHAEETTADKLDKLGGYSCSNSDFTCITLTVPLDHFDASNKATIEVVFGVLPATGERKGMFVTATGGPGTSGLASADSYTAAFDPSITEHFDIVFFDQRGAYQSGNLQCPEAVAVYYGSNWDAATPEQEKKLLRTAQTFTHDCIKEMGVDPTTLAYYGTKQAVADLDAFRQVFGDDKIWLYGESYGTQYTQTYAASYPEHVAGLILDGTVDLTHSLTDYYTEQTQAFSTIINDTLKACNKDETCAKDFADSDAVAAYDALVVELKSKAESFTYPLPNGERVPQQVTISDLQTVVSNLGYSEGDRMMLLRALAAASQGDLIPLKREYYLALGIDPATDKPVSGSTDDYSDALYYAVECNDYALLGNSSDTRAEAYLRAGDPIDAKIPDLASLFYGDLPCAYWPGNPPQERPGYLVAKGTPVLVLGATADPATPVENGQRVFQHLDNGYLITTDGGPHVIFGRGNACPDDLVTAFLVDGIVPSDRNTRCNGVMYDTYYPVAPADVSQFFSPLRALDSAYTEIYYLPEYYYGDTSQTVTAGCSVSGTLTLDPSEDSKQNIYLNTCSFTKGFIMTGEGAISDGTFSLTVAISGVQEGQLSFTYDSAGNAHVTGTYGGKKIDLSNP